MTQQQITQIPYSYVVAEATDKFGKVIPDELIKILEDEWLSTYNNMCNHAPNVLQFPDQGFTFLFDQVSANSSEAEDRLVAAYGCSTAQRKQRDKSRIRGFLGGGIEISGKGKFDKGHVLAHAIGGGLDINLFPQRPELNQGRSEAGKLYRQMEGYAAKNHGVFVFSRMIYEDESWAPTSLEYGIQLPEGKLWVEWFENYKA